MNERDLLGPYKLVLGMEVHLHLKTKTKMFCGCDANIYGAEPNTHVCPTCLGLPGALPVPNFEAITKTQMLGLAFGLKLNKNSKFDRKHYFYPDLPKGYQISQYKEPLCGDGFVELDSGTKVSVRRIHLEEDVAKSTHEHGNTLIDFNKSSMPLVEIVTDPTFTTTKDAVEFCKKVQDMVRHLNLGDVDMEKGQMRLEANISIRTEQMEKEGILPEYRVEVKNINSFRFMEKAVLAEITRQRSLLESGQTPDQENRGYDEDKNITVSQRSKEEAHDYRYFPEPDIPPMLFTEEHFDNLKSQLPELPEAIKNRLIKDYSLNEANAKFLSTSMGLALLPIFEEIMKANLDANKVANLLINKIEYQKLSPVEFISKYKIENDKITDEATLKGFIDSVIAANSTIVAEYKNGKTASLEFLLGMVMKESKGKADAVVTRSLLIKSLTD